MHSSPSVRTRLEQADRLDAQLKATGKPVGPLHGIPVIVKDNIDVAGLPMTSGYQGWKNYYPPADAPLVKKLTAAGAIILAKSSLSEFAYGIVDNVNSVLSGFARNPYNTAFATGGSSGGSAAALAASFGVVAIGTDTGGSVRMPSAFNALVGLRPTVGVISRTGMVPLNSVRDTAGPMARSVTDLAILLDVIAGPDVEDEATARARNHRPPTYTSGLRRDALKGARLGVLRKCSGQPSRKAVPGKRWILVAGRAVGERARLIRPRPVETRSAFVDCEPACQSSFGRQASSTSTCTHPRQSSIALLQIRHSVATRARRRRSSDWLNRSAHGRHL
jgi:amidase